MLGAATVTQLTDMETSFNNMFTSGNVDLTVGCHSTWNKGSQQEIIQIDTLENNPAAFFEWDDVKPGDDGEATFSFHVDNNDAWLWFQTCDLIQEPGDTPENEPTPDTGELAKNIEVMIWMDDGVHDGFGNDPIDFECETGGECFGGEGDNIYQEEFEDPPVFMGTLEEFLQQGINQPGPYHLKGSTTYYVGFAWNVPTTVGNEIQDDSLSFDVMFYVEQWRNNPNPIGPGSLCDAVGYWKMDDESGNTVTDSSGNNNHGTLMPNSPVWTSDGVINGALYFDGIDDYVEVPDDPSLDITDEITLMAWVYPENWDHDGYSAANGGDKTTENAILTKAGDSDYGVWNLHYKWNDDDGRFGFRFEANIDGNTENIFEVTPSEQLNKWYHIAGVYDGSEMKLFINGQKVDSKEVTGPISTNDQPLRFGKQFWWGDIYSMWNGSMDEIKIYDCSLSDAEIEDIYEHGYQFIDDTEPTTNTIMINEHGPQYDNNQYGYNFDYSTANVEFTYNMYDTTLRGTIQATGLKPYCTYQVKLIGIPECQDSVDGDDEANEYIGYKGRWTCVDCECSGSQCNRNDGDYEAHSPYRGDGSECIAGYLVFDYFTADENGDAHKLIEGKTSYHVLYAGGGICDSINNDDLYYPDANYPSLAFCPPDKVNGQSEPGRGGCNGLTLDSGNYNCQIALTEETFHQSSKWATVLDGMIEFNIN